MSKHLPNDGRQAFLRPRFAHLAALLLALAASGATLADEEKTTFLVNSRSYRTTPETDPPRYVRRADETGVAGLKELHWLDIGIEYRFRYEYREDDLRRPADRDLDDYLLSRGRLYLGIHDVLDPFRFVLELQDSRRSGSRFAPDNRDVNELDPLQAYAELYVKNALGEATPFSLRVGRMDFEVLDRRLLANNEFRNTTNNFQGARLNLGSKDNPWQLDMFALQPVTRRLERPDEPTDGQWLYAAILNWRQWSKVVTLQPHYFLLDQQPLQGRADRKLHTTGLRAYGLVPGTQFDYDANFDYQFGEDARRDHHAHAYALEGGYTFDHAWKPRASVFYGSGTGDEDPTDDSNERFDALFGFNQPWSRNDYYSWDNIRAPKLRLELTPSKKLRIDTGYNWYWLESERDGWQRAGLRDRTGNSGTYMGDEFDIRVRYQLLPQVATEASYSVYRPGEFTENLGREDLSHFIYLTVTLNPFGKG